MRTQQKNFFWTEVVVIHIEIDNQHQGWGEIEKKTHVTCIQLG
jgi:hypothetical protein